jgi:magnesium-transporting ATPase (P-type)
MEKEEFNATVLQATILAKLTPTQKLDVIQVVKVPLPIQGKFH